MNHTDQAQMMAPPAQFTLANRRVPLYRNVDVLVCGGGPAGVAAAVASARSGAATLLVERNVVLGGSGPLSFDIALGSPVAGIAAEIAARLRAGGHAEPDETAEGAFVYDPEALKYACLDMVREAGVSLLLSSWASDPIIEDGAVRGAMVENKSGRFAVRAKIVVDATGDGELAARAGAAVHMADVFTLGLNARIGGVDFDRALAGRDQWPGLIAAAKQAGALVPAQPDTLCLFGITPTARQRGMAFVSGPRFTGTSDWTATDSTRCETTARKLMRAFLAFLKSVPGFEASFIVDVAGMMAVGTTRRIVGDGALAPSGVNGILIAGEVAPFGAPFSPEGAGVLDGAALGERAGQAAGERVA